MKRIVLIPLLALVMFAFLATPDTTFSQDDGPATATVTTDAGTQVVPIEPADPFPGVSIEMALAIVTMLSPFVTWGFKLLSAWAVGNIPKFLLPVISGGIALLLTWLVSAQTGAGLEWYIYVLIALAGVGFREFNDRLVMKPAQFVKGISAGV